VFTQCADIKVASIYKHPNNKTALTVIYNKLQYSHLHKPKCCLSFPTSKATYFNKAHFGIWSNLYRVSVCSSYFSCRCGNRLQRLRKALPNTSMILASLTQPPLQQPKITWEPNHQ